MIPCDLELLHRSMDKARLHQELEFVRSAIRKAPHNESSWNYLQGFVSLSGGHKLLARSDQIHSICQASALKCCALIAFFCPKF